MSHTAYMVLSGLLQQGEDAEAKARRVKFSGLNNSIYFYLLPEENLKTSKLQIKFKLNATKEYKSIVKMLLFLCQESMLLFPKNKNNFKVVLLIFGVIFVTTINFLYRYAHFCKFDFCSPSFPPF